MVRMSSFCAAPSPRSPHTRGDGPKTTPRSPFYQVFSPHAWGWSADRQEHEERAEVLPTRVGMVRFGVSLAYLGTCSPHTRGDGPHSLDILPDNRLFSPHAWGWSARRSSDTDSKGVLPTRVGMVRKGAMPFLCCIGSPHTRGDGPTYHASGLSKLWFSPHAWGWSDGRDKSFDLEDVLPTRVGMVRSATSSHTSWGCSPHTRGDGPTHNTTKCHMPPFSPHAWGWSVTGRDDAGQAGVLPTRVGMVRNTRSRRSWLSGSPHTRGDGPASMRAAMTDTLFSPHAWGWSVEGVRVHAHGVVLPTRVGMVRSGPALARDPRGSPHTRGDGPVSKTIWLGSIPFSPHAWGWSEGDGRGQHRRAVLPTRVGIFRVGNIGCSTPTLQGVHSD